MNMGGKWRDSHETMQSQNKFVNNLLRRMDKCSSVSKEIGLYEGTVVLESIYFAPKIIINKNRGKSVKIFLGFVYIS